MVLAGQQHAVQSVLDWLRAWAWPFLWGPQRPSGVDDTRGIGPEAGSAPDACAPRVGRTEAETDGSGAVTDNSHSCVLTDHQVAT